MEEKVRRVDYIDTAKGIGILLVCVGHACTNQEKTQDCQLVDIIRFVTLFHMALFFFINGMLYSEKYSQYPIKGIFMKVKAYYFPFIKYNLFFWLCHNLFSKLHLISGTLDIKDYPYMGIRDFAVSLIKTLVGFRQKFSGAMWFLECLIVISVIFIILDYFSSKITTKKKKFILTAGVIIIVFINRLLNLIEISHIPSSISQMIYWGINGLLFFYLGYIYRIKRWNNKILKFQYPIIGITFTMLILAVCLMKPRIISVITNAGIPIYKYGLGAFWGNSEAHGLSLVEYFFYCIVAIAGIIFVLQISQLAFFNKLQIMKTLGRYSLQIMCLQFFAFKLVSLLIIIICRLPIERLAEYPVIYDINGLWWVIYTFVGCTLPVLYAKVEEKAKKKFFHST